MVSSQRTIRSKDAIVRVVTVCQDQVHTKDKAERVAATLELMDQAASLEADILCIPECFPGGDAEPVPGPSTEPVAKWAAEHNCNVICPLRTIVDGVKYNSAVIYDRKGDIVGRYDKVHLTEGALEESSMGNSGCPGPLDPPVFELDCATIGIQICFDVNWRQFWSMLKEKGAQILFWPSAYPAERRLAALAWMNEYYVVSSTIGRSSKIFDITGDVIATTGVFRQWTWADLNLGKRLFEIDYHIKKARQIEAKYGSKVELRWYHQEDWWTLASVSEDVSTAEIIKEFELTPLYDYLPRAEKANDDMRAERLPKERQA
ncbi:MAG: carbon-nitrogen hydrolase family protein [Phycisphaerae bacterium]|nr:carbon-nitrogen hydrolase family protein [Phycisphaerae bacterium]